jgi:pimeloyl-ACP methyl ester carboxylesterase
VAAAVLALAMTACGGPGAEPGDGEPERAATTTSAADPTQALREECLSAMPADAELEAFVLAGRTDGEISAARVGRPTSRTVAVLLPQISGMCGWGRWATAASGAGVSSLLIDPCGYGASTCSDAGDADPLDEVAPAVAHARDSMGADRVVLVGTSMGGSLTWQAAAAGAEVDSWVDVSGPSAWGGVDQQDVVGDLPPGGLVVYARSDGELEYRRAQQLARRSGARFLDGGSGHGWELLTTRGGRLLPAGRAVLAQVTGPVPR